MMLNCSSPAQLLSIGKILGSIIIPPLTIFLKGVPGAGKTTFVRGILRGCGYLDKVKSPSYSIMEFYPVDKFTLYHFDFYRLRCVSEITSLGIEEYWQEDAIFCVEWPENFTDFLPSADLIVTFNVTESGRDIIFAAATAGGSLLVQHLNLLLSNN